MSPPIHGTTKLGVVVGDPVSHSASPRMHNAAFAALNVDAVYVPMRVPSAALGAAVETLAAIGCIGASITVPHKVSVMRHCARLAPSAQAVGAVNCLEFASDGIVGHNTDASGYCDSLTEVFGSRRWRALVLGGGGAARAVAHGLNAFEVEVVARTPEKVDWARAQPWSIDVLNRLIAKSNLIIDCTSVGLSPDTDGSWPVDIDLSQSGAETVVSTLVYHRETALLQRARERGLSTLDGAGMLVHQGLAALRIWLGKAPPSAVLHEQLRPNS